MAGQIHLYLERREPTNADAFVGRLLIGDIDVAPPHQQGMLTLKLEFMADEAMKSEPPAHWVALSAEMRTTAQPGRLIGTVAIDPLQRPPFPPTPF